jgi:hypothetical protein
LYITANTEIGENIGHWYFDSSTKIGTLTNFGKSTDFGTFTGVPIAGIFTDFGIGTNTGTGNLRYRYRY